MKKILREMNYYIPPTLIVLSVLGLLYALFAGIWGFNPTEILWFNTKLGISCIGIIMVSAAYIRLFD